MNKGLNYVLATILAASNMTACGEKETKQQTQQVQTEYKNMSVVIEEIVENSFPARVTAIKNPPDKLPFQIIKVNDGKRTLRLLHLGELDTSYVVGDTVSITYEELQGTRVVSGLRMAALATKNLRGVYYYVEGEDIVGMHGVIYH